VFVAPEMQGDACCAGRFLLRNRIHMFHVDLTDPTPVPAQMERSLRAAIEDGVLGPGDPLPTARQLSITLRVNANLIAQAYRQMEAAGLLDLRQGLGAFVAAAPAARADAHEREERLSALEDRFLADAAALGFSLDEVIIHLHGRRRS
jgi:GntR family transcriptional regulator